MLPVTLSYHLTSSCWPLETHSCSRIFFLANTPHKQDRQTQASLPRTSLQKKKYYTIHKTCALLTKTIMGILFLQPCLSVLVSFQYRTDILKLEPNGNCIRIKLKPATEGRFCTAIVTTRGIPTVRDRSILLCLFCDVVWSFILLN